MKLTRYEQSCFCIQTEKISIYFDPYKVPKTAPKADIILISHPHFDHNDSKSIARIAQENTTVICPKTVKSIQKRWNAIGLDLFEHINVENIEIYGFPARNLKIPLHTPKKRWLGYVIVIEGNRVYHAGDTELIPEMKDLKNINIAFLPCGKTFTMDPVAMIESVSWIQPDYVIPMHERGQDLKWIKNESEKITPQTTILTLSPGDSYDFPIKRDDLTNQ